MSTVYVRAGPFRVSDVPIRDGDFLLQQQFRQCFRQPLFVLIA